ncbi:MAG TPA: thiamine pyrophosphate-dependent enzyme [Thermodesulfobacteriota bacterium]|nr:thiamine pyrophosphate-dependent enzyme [Thermodesulfobacteriota bacterium]
MRYDLPKEELLYSGHIGCPGCGGSLAMRYALQALGRKTVIVIPACCWSTVGGFFPSTSLKVPILHTAFETAAVTAAGVKRGMAARGIEDVRVMAWAGDGGTFDIGLQSLSGAAERNDDIIYACYDNEAYMNTGIQRSSATPFMSWTTTTPGQALKDTPKKDIMEIMAAHRIPYAATATPAFPEDFLTKMRKAKEMKGLRFIHILSACPPGWKFPSEISVKLSRLAVDTRIFPLYEIENGRRYRITAEPKGTPVGEYLRLQGRFSALREEDVRFIQARVDEEWKILQEKVRRTGALKKLRGTPALPSPPCRGRGKGEGASRLAGK